VLGGHRIALLAASLLSWPAFAAAQTIPAFSGAEGFGALATGARGGSVYHVTNLNDSGSGSFRDAVSQSNRTVVFDVGGVINITTELAFANNITVAGQTAPGDGIVVNGHGVSLSNRSNAIVRYVRFRSSHNTSDGTKTFNVSNGSNMIFDHLSISWGRWDNLGFTDNSHDLTLQNSIDSESIDPQRLGGLIDSATNVTVSHNLWADNQSRNPKGKGHLQYINNVVYNWGSNGYVGGHSAAVWNQDLVNNYFIQGPSSGNTFLSQFASTDHVYHTGNIVDLDRDGALGGRAVVDSDFKANDATSGPPTFVAAAYNHPAISVTYTSAADAYTRVIADAGDSLHRDNADTRVVGQLTSLGSLGAIITSETAVGGEGVVAGGAAPTDTDQDGMPNVWEVAHGLNPNSAADRNGDFDTDGYTNLEDYLNELGAFPALQPIVFNGSTNNRFAQITNWDIQWQPSRFDEAQINSGVAVVDAVGQHAGTLKIGAHAGDNGTLNITAGRLEVAAQVIIGAEPVAAAALNLSGGELSVPTLTKDPRGSFNFTGGTLHADMVDFTLVNNGGTISPGHSIGQTHVAGDLTLNSGSLAIELASASLADTLVVDGSVALGGSLNVSLLNGFEPIHGETWQIIAAGGFTGDFNSITAGYSVQKQGNSLLLVFGVPEPTGLVLVGTTLLAAVAGRNTWERRSSNSRFI
jgi:hypothetical protein